MNVDRCVKLRISMSKTRHLWMELILCPQHHVIFLILLLRFFPEKIEESFGLITMPRIATLDLEIEPMATHIGGGVDVIVLGMM